MKDDAILLDHDLNDNTSIHTKKRRMEYTNKESITATMINPLYQQRSFQVAPDFNCSAVIDPQLASDYYLSMTMNSYRCQLSHLLQHTKAVVLFFYGRDFTTVAGSDLMSISANIDRFKQQAAIPLGLSIDTEQVHQSYLQYHQQQYQQILPFPLLSDPTRSIVRHFNILNKNTSVAERAVFIIDRSRQIQFSFVLGDDRIHHSMDTIMTTLQMLPTT
ncbi:thioredoxin-like protein [Halteromyces radiatus]|uniref:thioredoxin-like protein n=1 Tax=Halteromyces radiatus TaxID=101107 RepID=UPI00221EF490|nr:thioredoxin-like protein [Halteromyces radiatus]KAI8078672.1 thioredoxin-like protein [Halteromyces radiatus]